MKKLACILLLIICFSFIHAIEHLVIIKSDAIMKIWRVNDPESLAKTLTNNAFDILYNTQDDYLCKADDAQLSRLPRNSYIELSSLPTAQSFYLISDPQGKQVILPSTAGTILHSFGSVALIKSNLTEEVLRKATQLSCVRLDLTALKIQPVEVIYHPQPINGRTVIQNLVQSVNADSVQWFVQQMQNFGTRYAMANNRFTVANWIKNQFLRMGITDVSLHQFVWNGYDEYDVVATKTGTEQPNTFIIIGGHHDSVVYDGYDPMIIAPGADDNATSTATVLEMARVMHLNNFQPECSIRFVTFAAEEVGLYGSKAYSQYALDNNMNIRLMMNHDMTGNSSQNSSNWQVRLMPYTGVDEYTTYAMDLTEQYSTLNPYRGTYNSASSDSYPFWQKGFPVIYFFEHEFCPYYHSINDILANMNPTYCAEIVKASVAVAANTSLLPSSPQNVRAIDSGNGQTVIATWDAVQEPDVVGYKVYYGTTLGSMEHMIETTQTSVTINGLVTGTMYYLNVSAVDTDQYESFSVQVSVTPNLIPLMPLGFIDEPQLNAVRLNWSANSEADLVGYMLYKSTTADQLGNPVTTNPITNNHYLDEAVVPTLYYYYTLSAVDQDGHQSQHTAQLKSRAVTLNQGILVVDETLNSSGSSYYAPSDVQADEFYHSIMGAYPYSQLDTETDPVLNLADIGVYSTIIWHGNDYNDMNYPYMVRSDIQKYLDFGGNLLISSYLPSMAFDLNAAYPHVYHQGSFMFDALGIGEVSYNNSARFRYALPNNNAYPTLVVDSLKTNASFNGHLFKIEAISPAPNAQAIYLYGSDYANNTTQGQLNGLPVGVMKQNPNGKVITLSFPLYNMKQAQAMQLMQYVLHDIFSETGLDDDSTDVISPISLLAPYPNPFEKISFISYRCKETDVPVSIRIYNIKGQFIKNIEPPEPQSKSYNQITWDGTDNRGKNVTNGVYIVKVSQHGKSAIRKIMLLK